MARNIDYGENGNLIPFNCYRAIKNDKGRLIKDDVVMDRIYCNIVDETRGRNNINNTIRAIGFTATITTTCPNELEEDYYIENVYSGDVWKIDSITRNPINSGSYENARRTSFETRMVCSK